jgi:drug/metabolite transporter (DMT)-like permease
MIKEFKADFSLLIVTLIWGASYPLMSLVVKGIPPFSFLVIRYLISGIILAVICGGKLKKINKATIKAAVFVGGTLGIGCSFQLFGLLYTTPSKSGFITGLSVVFVPVFMGFMYKKLPDKKTILGVILSLLGLWLISIKQGVMDINFGDILTIGCAAVFALQIISVDKFAKEVDVMLLTCLEMFIIGIMSIPPAIVIDKFNITFDLFTLAAMGFMIIFGTIVAHSVQNKMQPLTNPSHAAIIYLAEPVFGAIFSSFLGDVLTGKALMGCLLILGGMIIINLKR